MLYAEDFRRIAREALDGKWALAVGTGLVAAILGGQSRISAPDFQWQNTSNDLYATDLGASLLPFIIGFTSVFIIWVLIALIFGGAVELGYCRFNLNLIRNENPQFNDLFSKFSIFWKAFGLRIVTSIFILFWTLLFIIPGIIAAYRYSMAYYIMAEDPSIGIMEAIERSKQMMLGNKWRLFCLDFSFIGWAILCIFTCGIGYLWLLPYMYAATTVFYLELSGQNKEQQDQVILEQNY